MTRKELLDGIYEMVLDNPTEILEFEVPDISVSLPQDFNLDGIEREDGERWDELYGCLSNVRNHWGLEAWTATIMPNGDYGSENHYPLDTLSLNNLEKIYNYLKIR